MVVEDKLDVVNRESVLHWWRWNVAIAEHYYLLWLQLDTEARNALFVDDEIPKGWSVIETAIPDEYTKIAENDREFGYQARVVSF